MILDIASSFPYALQQSTIPSPYLKIAAESLDTAKIIKTQVLLTSQDKWTPWINQIKFKAMDLRVWQYLDPNLDDPNEPLEPVEPTFSDVNPTAASFKILTQNKKKIYKFLIL